MKHILESPNKDELMIQLLPKDDDKEHQDISQDAKDTGKEQSNLEAHEILMIIDTGQCSSGYKHAIPTHTCCECGLILPGRDDEVKKTIPQERHELLEDGHNQRICS